jgi:hypothetical protein
MVQEHEHEIVIFLAEIVWYFVLPLFIQSVLITTQLDTTFL